MKIKAFGARGRAPSHLPALSHDVFPPGHCLGTVTKQKALGIHTPGPSKVFKDLIQCLESTRIHYRSLPAVNFERKLLEIGRLALCLDVKEAWMHVLTFSSNTL